MKKVLWQNTMVKDKRFLLSFIVALSALATLIWFGSREKSDPAEEQSQKISSIKSMIEAYRRNLLERAARDRSAKKKIPPDEDEIIRRYTQRLLLEILESADDYLNDPQGYIRDLIDTSSSEIPYHKVNGIIGREHLPMLESMLRDRSYSKQWPDIALIVGYMGAGQDGADILMDYITRHDVYDNRSDKRYNEGNKIFHIQLLGMTGYTGYNDFLRRALTREGAERLAWNMINDPDLIPTGNNINVREDMINKVITLAARSLVFLGDEQDKNTLKNLYEQERAKRLSGETTTFRLFDGMAEVMALMEFAETFSAQHYFYQFDFRESEPSIYINYYLKLVDKYRI